MSKREDVPQPGDVLAGKFQVEEVLGKGGMGVVVAARHLALRRRVALKFLLPSVVENLPNAASRFLREAQAAVAIQSEHIARVLDVGTLENGLPYMVMEHLSGVDFSRYLKENGALSVEDAIDFVLQACEAVAEAHAMGIVHRDIKPGNLFLTRRPDGSPLVKVLDFGLSKMTLTGEENAEGLVTTTSVVVGSPQYMSPEQMRSLKNADHRTDIWALGVVLFELLTGDRPFSAPTLVAICAGVIADDPVAVSSIREGIPPQLDQVIFDCLKKDPTERIANVASLAVRLAPFAPKRSEQSIERIRRLLPETEPIRVRNELLVTLPMYNQPAPFRGPAFMPNQPVAQATDAASSAHSSEVHRSSELNPVGTVTAAVGWGQTQSRANHDPSNGKNVARHPFVIGSVALGLFLFLAALVLVVSDGREATQTGSAPVATAISAQVPVPMPTMSLSTTSETPPPTSDPVKGVPSSSGSASTSASTDSPKLRSTRQPASKSQKQVESPATTPDPFDKPN